MTWRRVARARVASSATVVPRRGLQRDGQGDGLGIVEQHGRHMSAGLQPIAAGRSFDGFDRVVEFAQAVDVTPHRARGDAEALRKIIAGPVTVRLKEREQREQPRGRFMHDTISLAVQDTTCPLPLPSWHTSRSRRHRSWSRQPPLDLDGRRCIHHIEQGAGHVRHDHHSPELPGRLHVRRWTSTSPSSADVLSRSPTRTRAPCRTRARRTG